MFSARVSASDPLYGKLNEYLAQVTDESIVVASRGDYQRDLSIVRRTLDFGRCTVKLKEPEEVSYSVDHRAPDTQVGISDATFVITSTSQTANLRLIRVAAQWQNSEPEPQVQQLVPVFSWENAWHQRQAIHMPASDSPSSSQLAIAEDAAWFYANGSYFADRKLPFQRGVLLTGPSGSGKRWVVRHVALKHRKMMCYFPVTETTYAAISPAISCAPMNSIVAVDNLVNFFNGIPVTERGVFLRHLQSVFNFVAHDPKGLLLFFLFPLTVPPELDKFLLMPHRIQRKFELAVWDKEVLSRTLRENFPKEAKDVTIDRLAGQLAEARVSDAVLRWHFVSARRQGGASPPSSPRGLDASIRDIEELASAMREERFIIDQTSEQTQASRERLYS